MVGEVLANRFKLVSLLGQGGYGAVFEATQLSMRRRCAVKVLHERLLGDTMASERFRAEAIATSKLQQGNSVIIYDFGEDEERNLLFIAMEYLEGISLNDLIKQEKKLPLDVVLHIVEQMASSLQDAHDNGIVHRDIKPHNAMVMQRGKDPYFVKVIDFGIAKLLQEATLTPLDKVTQTGVMIGTPHYMAPEQIRGQAVDGRTDQYALANCIYKMLLGYTPLQGNTPVDVAVQQLTDMPKPLRAFDETLEVNDSFEQVLLRALSKEIEDRYPRITDFASALRASLRGQATVPIDISKMKLPDASSISIERSAIEPTMDAPVVAATGPMAFDPMTGEPLVKKMTGDAFAPTSEQRQPSPRRARDSGPTPLGEGIDLSGSLGASKSRELVEDGSTVAAKTPTPSPRDQPAFRTDLTLQALTPPNDGEEKEQEKEQARSNEETPSSRTASIPEPSEPSTSARSGDDTLEQRSPATEEKSRLPILLVGLFLSVALLVAVFAIITSTRGEKGSAQDTPNNTVATVQDDQIVDTTAANTAALPANATTTLTETTPTETSPAGTTKVADAAPKTGSAKVSITGKGSLFVDSTEVALPESGELSLAEGTHVLEVRQGGKVRDTKRVEIKGGETLEVSLEGHVATAAARTVDSGEKKPEKVAPARVTVRVSGEGEIELDGKSGKVEENKEVALEPGKYTFTVVHDGSPTDSDTVELKSGQRKTIKLKGHRQQAFVNVTVAIIPAGTLLVNNRPVTIDGSNRKAKLPVGRQTVQARYADGTTSERRTVNITNGDNAKIVFNRNM